MNHLHRELAPISTTAWAEIEKEAKRTLKTTLAARRLIDFVGPKGWDEAAIAIGRSEEIDPPAPAVSARLRRVLPLVELRADFRLRRIELEAIERGAKDPDLDPVIHAARAIAIAEDRAIFDGYPAAAIRGISEAQAAATVPVAGGFLGYPDAVATALNRLRDNGVDGPYAIALSEAAYAGLTETTRDGYPVLQHVKRLTEGPIVWAPALEGGLVLSLRGGDFEMTVGQDFSIGYRSHDADTVELYLEESFSFWLLSPQAAIPLAPPG